MPKETSRAPSAVNPNVPVELDRPRTLRFDLGALCAFEETTGGSFDEAFRALMEHPTARTIRALLWAGLLHESPDLTIEDAGRLVGPGDLFRVGRAIGQAIAMVIAPASEDAEVKSPDRPLPPSPSEPTG